LIFWNFVSWWKFLVKFRDLNFLIFSKSIISKRQVHFLMKSQRQKFSWNLPLTESVVGFVSVFVDIFYVFLKFSIQSGGGQQSNLPKNYRFPTLKWWEYLPLISFRNAFWIAVVGNSMPRHRHSAKKYEITTPDVLIFNWNSKMR
jgi:hypothetical protein